MFEYTKILPKFDASQAYESKDFICPECRKSGIGYPELKKPALVGWCDTEWGYMMIVECQDCFTKYMFHGTALYKQKHDIDAFNHSIKLYLMSDYFSNSSSFSI